MLAVGREGGGGGGYCVQITKPPPRATHRRENRYTRPTGTIKQLFGGGGAFFFFAVRLASRSNRAAATSRTTAMSPYILYCSMPLLSNVVTTLLTMYLKVSSVLLCLVALHGD